MAKQYHISQPGGSPQGPHDVATIQQMLNAGQIDTTWLVFGEGMDNWAPVTTIVQAPAPKPAVPPAPAPAPMPAPAPAPAYAQPVYVQPVNTQPRSTVAYILLGLFFGGLGIHNFYAGHSSKGTAQLLITLLSCATLSIVSGIWALIDICTVRKDANGVPFQ